MKQAVEDEKNKILLGEPEEEYCLANLRVYGRIILKWIFNRV
jgi:hypothetical protein